MAFHEVYQVYNPQNKQFVKMRNGQILDNSYFRFEDVPLFGSEPPEDHEPPAKAKKEKPTRAENDKPAKHTKNDSQATVKEDDSGVFSWF